MITVNFRAHRWLAERLSEIPDGYLALFRDSLPELGEHEVVLDQSVPDSLLCIAVLLSSKKEGQVYRTSPKNRPSPQVVKYLLGLAVLEAHLIYGDRVKKSDTLSLRRGGVLVIESASKKRKTPT